jgi:hypothetical protein
MNKVVMFDIDGVLADFKLGYTKLAVDLGYMSTPYGTLDERNTDWEIPEITEAQTNVLWEKIKSSNMWWMQLEPMWPREVFRNINDLSRFKDVYFVTSRVGVDCLGQSKAWLKGMGVYDPNVIVSSKKGEIARGIKANWMIDDKAGNVIYTMYHSTATEVYLLGAQFNKFSPKVLGSRVHRVETIYPFMEAILG